MKIDTTREGGSALLQLEGRLDREWAEHLSETLEELLHEGVRTVRLDFSRVTYVSSAATTVLARCRQELAALRGEVHLTSLPPAVREVFDIVGWDSAATEGPGIGSRGPRRSSWSSRASFARSGLYEAASCTPAGTLTCVLHGDPDRLARAPVGPGDCDVAAFPEGTFGFGLGTIGGSYEDCHERFGELVAVAGCVAYFPSDGARMADYFVGGGKEGVAPRAVLASGVSCQGGFSQLVRFSARPQAEAVPLSELAAISLETVGGRIAGLVIAGETAGLCGVRLRRSPARAAAPLRFEVPAVRDWLLFAPERTHPMTTTIIAGVVARAPAGALAAHLRPLGETGKLFGHFHAAVFSYHPLPQRTVELTDLVRELFANHALQDVLHLIWDDRGEAGVDESALLRGVAWVAPVTEVR